MFLPTFSSSSSNLAPQAPVAPTPRRSHPHPPNPSPRHGAPQPYPVPGHGLLWGCPFSLPTLTMLRSMRLTFLERARRARHPPPPPHAKSRRRGFFRSPTSSPRRTRSECRRPTAARVPARGAGRPWLQPVTLGRTTFSLDRPYCVSNLTRIMQFMDARRKHSWHGGS